MALHLSHDDGLSEAQFDALNRDVCRLLAATARLDILPLHKALSHEQIHHKANGERFTAADLAAERRLTQGLAALITNSQVVGEEAAAETPEILQRLAEDQAVWVIDPLDGTHNFIHGKGPFGILVALCRGGKTVAGWLHDPVAGVTAWSHRGGGAYINGQPVKPPAAPPTLAQASGSYKRSRRRDFLDQGGEAAPLCRRHGCVAYEYLALAQGRLDFAVYERLKPWDHAAGVLLCQESGLFAALAPSGQPYGPRTTSGSECLIVAPDAQTWHTLSQILART